MIRVRGLSGALCVLALMWSQAAMAAPDVVVSIKPIHSLVSSVMQGVGEPHLLVQGAESPHSFSLRPSQARVLHDADAVFWVGRGLEDFLVKPLKTLSRQAKIVSFLNELELLSYRHEGVWAENKGMDHHDKEAGHHDKHADHQDKETDHHEKEGDRHEKHEHDHGVTDPHFWLDPTLAVTAVSIIVRQLSEIDGKNEALYRRNGEALVVRLKALHLQTQAKLDSVRAVPYLVFHDAYQYFEKRYQLNAIGTVTVNPEYRPGAKHIDAVRRHAGQADAQCIFREPQFRPSMLNVIVADTEMRVAVLDPLGASLDPGPDAYFKVIDALSDSLSACLSEKRADVVGSFFVGRAGNVSRIFRYR